ncbi:hypothetical protein NDU88_001605 [Pleurodeles waltl]|uniref:Uncharacterized protein n=1 Tax=Pleurodeles waltl TaxID=8319 RepID=A0AAV7MQD3_PLEWA|nr:hypothetical protein NDU88_001605 [Pleurodeles waltl]
MSVAGLCLRSPQLSQERHRHFGIAQTAVPNCARKRHTHGTLHAPCSLTPKKTIFRFYSGVSVRTFTENKQRTSTSET